MDHVKAVAVDLESKLATVEVEADNYIDAMNMLPIFVTTINVRVRIVLSSWGLWQHCGHGHAAVKLAVTGLQQQVLAATFFPA